MRKWILLLAPLMVLVGVSGCSGGAGAPVPETAATPVTTTVEAAGTGLDGVEFIIHQAPG